uniref:Periplanetasin-2 n=1 Tax=Periplaneta americana TaxID=6978 RepID=PERI2_PERAM|nr:RecName: Full=Periplanetasin-2; Short=Peri-2 [Periplaneta americana]
YPCKLNLKLGKVPFH